MVEKVKKKILIFSHGMEIGGAERALLGMLELIDYDEYDVDLFLMRHCGELLKYIPERVNLLSEMKAYSCLAVPILDVLKKGELGVFFGRVFGKFYAKYRVKKLGLSGDNGVAIEYSHKYTKKFMPEINSKKYDVAISYLTPHYFVQENVNADFKVAWIHTDYSKVAVDVVSELKMWGCYDRIVSISESVTQTFLSVFPSLCDKVSIFENQMAKECILKQVNEFTVSNEMVEDGSIKLLSVGRFCHAKNFDNVPEICSRILKCGLNVRWYLIGFGGSEDLIRSKIKEYHMEDFVIVLGKKENPYPYMQACDVYVQPSRYEGNAVTVHEAQFLNRPVIITNYSTSSSQLERDKEGYIVPMDNEGCAKGIVEILESVVKE